MLQVSQRTKNLAASPIRKFLPDMMAAEAEGVKVLKVHVGDPDLDIPPEFMETVRSYKYKTLGYAPSPGITAHTQAWQNYYRQFGVTLKMQSIVPTVGCAEAIMMALTTVADFGDEVIVFEPVYTNYKPFAAILGIKLVPVTLPLENNFVLPNLGVVREKIRPRTKAILLVNPDNPTGKLWSNKELDGIAQLALEYDLFILSDETYREIRFDNELPVCMLGRADVQQNVIMVDSVSKRFSLTGARIGCVASHNEEVMQSVLKIAQARLSAGTLEQLGTVPLLNNSHRHVAPLVQEYWRRREAVIGSLNIEGAVFRPSMGAFYQVVGLPVDNADNFVRFMISKFRYENRTVMVTPMKDFYITPGLGNNEIRIAYVLDSNSMAMAMYLLRLGVEAYNRQ